MREGGREGGSDHCSVLKYKYKNDLERMLLLLVLNIFIITIVLKIVTLLCLDVV